MRVVIIGAGAIGSVLGGLLAKSGHDVTLLGRAWHLDVVQQRGLTITGIWGEHHIRNLTTATRLDDIPTSPPYDWVFVCVKSYDTESAAKAVLRFLGPATLVCAFQNGLGNYDTLIQHLPPERIALGRIIFGVELEPGQVRVTVCADEVLIGAPDPRVPQEAMARLAAALKESGVPARTTSTILVALWGKVLYNCALNGLSTLFEVSYGELLEHPIAARMMRAIIEEAYAVATAHHVPLKPATAAEYVELLFTRLIPTTAVHHSSMLQDVQRHARTEIESLNGAIVRLGQQVGIDTPMNALVTRLVHTKERFLARQ